MKKVLAIYSRTAYPFMDKIISDISSYCSDEAEFVFLDYLPSLEEVQGISPNLIMMGHIFNYEEFQKSAFHPRDWDFGGGSGMYAGLSLPKRLLEKSIEIPVMLYGTFRYFRNKEKPLNVSENLTMPELMGNVLDEIRIQLA